ncbi:MAG TPA: hypothetical protein VD789_13125, partial [Thermomicrobiales bacterium]|nr:hypothetical protein [Thermomicrobiales bacterium]
WIALYGVLRSLDDDRIWQGLASASGRLRRQQEGLDRPTRTRTMNRRGKASQRRSDCRSG